MYSKNPQLRRPKNLVFKNLLGYNFPARRPLYKNLFSLKFETTSYFLKSMKKILYTWAKNNESKSTSKILFGET